MIVRKPLNLTLNMWKHFHGELQFAQWRIDAELSQLKFYFWNFSRATLYEEADKLDESLGDYRKILEIDASNVEARANIARLTPIVEERNERLKAEMMGKLKDLGNMILKPFGLSTNNFQMQQDPNTGSYSVNFNQGAGKWNKLVSD